MASIISEVRNHRDELEGQLWQVNCSAGKDLLNHTQISVIHSSRPEKHENNHVTSTQKFQWKFCSTALSDLVQNNFMILSDCVKMFPTEPKLTKYPAKSSKKGVRKTKDAASRGSEKEKSKGQGNFSTQKQSQNFAFCTCPNFGRSTAIDNLVWRPVYYLFWSKIWASFGTFWLSGE